MPSVSESTEPGDPPGGRIDLPGIESSAAAARRFVRSLLGDTHPAIDDVLVVVSELVTNAVLHSRSGRNGTVRLTVRDADHLVRVEVADEGNPAAAPYLRNDPCAESGRGLQIVSTLAKQWGARTVATGRVVWCEIAY